MWIEGMTRKQAAMRVLHGYLVRCHHLVSKDYPDVAEMTPEESADYLVNLKENGIITIILFPKPNNLVGCKITHLPTTNTNP